MVKLVNTLDSKSSAERLLGSSPSTPTTIRMISPECDVRAPIISRLVNEGVSDMTKHFLGRWMDHYLRFYNFITRTADTSKARATLYLYSALESVIIPLPTDPLLVLCVLARPQNWFRITACTAMASVIGGAVGWAIGACLSGSIEALFAVLPNAIAGPEKFQHVQDAYQQLGLLLVLVGAFTPLPYKIIALSAGMFGYGLLPFLILSVVGRTARFMIIAGMARWHRNPRTLITLLSVLLIAFGAGFYLLH